MTIVTISRGSFSMGREVAEKVARRLEYECISREILLEASGKYDIPEIKLERAIADAPSALERFTHGTHNYVAYFQSALAGHMRHDNVVYHGLAGHILLKNVTHVLKVRIIADLDRRVDVLVRREGVTEGEAKSWIAKVDSERRKWTKSLYNLDPQDPSIYDLTVKINTFDVEDAVNMICEATSRDAFKATPLSKQHMEDLSLSCDIKARLIEKNPDISVSSHKGNVVVYTKRSERHAREIRSAVTQLKLDDGKSLNTVEVHTDVTPPQTAV